jgi:hypothetical protein
LEEEVEGSILPKVAAAMVIGAGRNRQAMAVAIPSPESSGVSEESE